MTSSLFLLNKLSTKTTTLKRLYIAWSWTAGMVFQHSSGKKLLKIINGRLTLLKTILPLTSTDIRLPCTILLTHVTLR